MNKNNEKRDMIFILISIYTVFFILPKYLRPQDTGTVSVVPNPYLMPPVYDYPVQSYPDAGGGVYYHKGDNGDEMPIHIEITPSEPVACTMDAKVCSDGSAVGRVGPNCEFAPCPGE